MLCSSCQKGSINKLWLENEMSRVGFLRYSFKLDFKMTCLSKQGAVCVGNPENYSTIHFGLLDIDTAHAHCHILYSIYII